MLLVPAKDLLHRRIQRPANVQQRCRSPNRVPLWLIALGRRYTPSEVSSVAPLRHPVFASIAHDWLQRILQKLPGKWCSGSTTLASTEWMQIVPDRESGQCRLPSCQQNRTFQEQSALPQEISACQVYLRQAVPEQVAEDKQRGHVSADHRED